MKVNNKRKKQHSFFINNNYVTASLQIANAVNNTIFLYVCNIIDYICLIIIIILAYNVLMLYVPCIFYINVCYFYFLIYSLDVPLCMIFNKQTNK